MLLEFPVEKRGCLVALQLQYQVLFMGLLEPLKRAYHVVDFNINGLLELHIHFWESRWSEHLLE